MKNTTIIYGKHVVKTALEKKPDTVKRIFYKEKAIFNFLPGNIHARGIECISFFEAVKQNMLPADFDEINHQGVLAEIASNELMVPYKDFINKLRIDQNTALIILGEVEDPQNVGAVIRSAVAFGFAGVLIPEHNQAQFSGAVAKVSAGNSFNIPLVKIGNVNTVIKDLKEKDFWIYGLDAAAEKKIHEENFDRPTVFILGNEGEGLREKTREHCDFLLSISMNKKCESLNAATSASLAMHQWSTQHPDALK